MQCLLLPRHWLIHLTKMAHLVPCNISKQWDAPITSLKYKWPYFHVHTCIRYITSIPLSLPMKSTEIRSFSLCITDHNEWWLIFPAHVKWYINLHLFPIQTKFICRAIETFLFCISSSAFFWLPCCLSLPSCFHIYIEMYVAAVAMPTNAAHRVCLGLGCGRERQKDNGRERESV